jgi:twitching motility two-component system response regulator PilH
MASILLSEDDASILELMALILAKAGHAVTAAPSNLDILKRLGIRPEDPSARLPDLVVLDVMTPKLDGYSAARVIRDHPRTHAVPILIVSGLQEIDRLFAVTVKTQGFLKKPFRPDEFLDLVAQILGQSQPDGRHHG